MKKKIIRGQIQKNYILVLLPRAMH